MEKMFNKMLENRNLKVSVIATFVIGIITHAFVYFNDIYIHDMVEVSFDKASYHSAAGTKWFNEILYDLVDFTNVPWLSGILALACVAISTYMICDLLKIRKELYIVLVSAILVTDEAFIASHLYISSLYIYAFALLFSVCSVWIEERFIGKNCLVGVIVGAFFIALSSGTYGSYICVAACLMLIRAIMDIWEFDDKKYIIKKMIIYLSTFVLGILLFYIILKICLVVQDVELQTYMGEDSLNNGIVTLFKYIPLAYYELFNYYFRSGKVLKGIVYFFVILYIVIECCYFVSRSEKKNKMFRIIVSIVGIVLFPLAENLIYVMSSGNVHYLMTFSYCMIFLIVIKLIDSGTERINKNSIEKIINSTVIVLLLVFVYRDILLANVAYTHAKSMSQISETIGTNLIHDIQNIEGFTGDESIVLIGDIYYSEYFSKKSTIGMDIISGFGVVDPKYTNGFTYSGVVPRYMNNILGFPMNMFACENIEDFDFCYSKYKGQADDMKCYPAEGGIKKIDDLIIVRFN